MKLVITVTTLFVALKGTQASSYPAWGLEHSGAEFLQNFFENFQDEIFFQIGNAHDVPNLIKNLNTDIGCDVFQLNNNNESISLSSVQICNLIRNKIHNILNNFQLNWLDKVVNDEIDNNLKPDLEKILTGSSVSVNDLKEITRNDVGFSRRKRDALSDMLNSLILTTLANLLAPAKAVIDTTLANFRIIVVSLKFNLTDTSDVIRILIGNLVNTVVDQALVLIDLFVTFIDNSYDAVFNPTKNVTTSRRKRDLSLDFDQSLIETHSRVKRSFDIGSIFTSITSWIVNLWIVLSGYINPLIKNFFVTYISGFYESVGSLVLSPARCLVNYVVNLIFQCSTCASIC